MNPNIYERRVGKQRVVAAVIAIGYCNQQWHAVACGTAMAACGDVQWRAAGSVRHAAGGGRRAAGGGRWAAAAMMETAMLRRQQRVAICGSSPIEVTAMVFDL